jgi:hypothetical protein
MKMRRLAIAICAVAVFANCYNKQHHLPTDPGFVGALVLNASAATLPADGFSRLKLTATVDPDVATANRSVTFKTTAGTFSGAAAPGKEIQVAADTRGIAEAEFVSSTSIETATITATDAGITKTVTISFVPVVPTDIVRLSLSDNQLPADGVIVMQVYADVAAALPSAARSVSFGTSAGKFVASGSTTTTVVASASNRATADLQAPTTPAIARVTAMVNGVTAETLVSFVISLPDSVSVDTSSFAVKANDTVTITASLRRNNGGKVTSGQNVTFRAFDKGGQSVGVFRNVKPSDDSGAATATFSPDGNALRDVVTIRATTVSAAGTAITGEVQVRIVDP